ncbi:hypothetical protein K438DRAFT_1947612 [Mycena galopus ATCC 62051]|nr:hypothetical protein K438DRAFT_1947612 [Mycena galopus ATCC 62051]
MTCDGEDSETTAIALGVDTGEGDGRYGRFVLRERRARRVPMISAVRNGDGIAQWRIAQRDKRLIPCVEKGRRDETRMHFACEPGQMAPEGRVEGCDQCGVETQNIDGETSYRRGDAGRPPAISVGGEIGDSEASDINPSIGAASTVLPKPPHLCTTASRLTLASTNLFNRYEPSSSNFCGSSTGMRVLLLEGRKPMTTGTERRKQDSVTTSRKSGVTTKIVTGTVSSDEKMVEEGETAEGLDYLVQKQFFPQDIHSAQQCLSHTR